MFKKDKAEAITVDIRYKPKRTMFGRTKMVRTTAAEQKKMRKAILNYYPGSKIIDSKYEKQHRSDWIDRIEEIDAALDDD